MSNLSILIPTYNRPTEFKYLISTLISNLKIDYEIIVLDNNPSSETYVEDTMWLLNKYTNWDPSRIKIFKGENYSEIRFRPDLIKYSSGKYLWFIDDDCIVDTYGLSNVNWDLLNEDKEIYTLPFNQFYMESELYDKVYSYNLYDFIFRRDLFNYDVFITLYSNPYEYKIGGDKEIMKYISFYSKDHVSICKFPVIINLYRRNGDNLMLNKENKK